ncbi:hypothetical protein DICPUDRAFT_160017 [Dictyostelium purpureum]|uniref:BTB domain-containing protein n=1 Tax=Dictyostelium purpureum TaxID=5786 RepID=F1A5I1_DICPU|nr:uncharacterized protein DICPUDRAFT_160017 [Dictyostelium purpureum]EGC28549.1 hypothetical protein DICPUDRAFT_160017 [Dictyostelium purpureum]|eukprot:XP_003294926.1 hypothetical protein DICPUDRAFT_160017 [Dictyostelium purpureum]
MIPNLKVKINNKFDTSLYFAQKNFEDLKYVDLKKRPPIAYHYLYYDVQTHTTYSSNLTESNRTEVIGKVLLYKGLQYTHEAEWEMVYLNQGHSHNSIIGWSWEFDKTFGISNLIFDLCFFTFHIDTVNWYVCKEVIKDNNISEEYLKKNALLLPLGTVNKLVVFDKKIDITEYIKGSSSFCLVCFIPRNTSTQLFRSKSLEYVDRPPFNTNPNDYQHQYKYPFGVYIELSPIGRKEDDNQKKQNINNNYHYYFIESYPGLKSPIESESWGVDRLQCWLSDRLFFEFMDYFRRNGIDGKKVFSLDIDTEFKSSGISRDRIAKLKKQLIKLKSFGAKKETLYTVDKKMITSNTILTLKKKLTKEEDSSGRDYNSTKNSSNNNNNNNNKELEVRVNDDTSDYKIIIKDKEINVHRKMLSKIEYFRVLFNSIFKENKENFSKFDDEDYETFKSLLEILYLHNEEKVEFLKTLEPIQLRNILFLSNRLLYQKLEFMIENYILWNVNTENAMDVYNGFAGNEPIQLFTENFLKITKKQ